MSKIIVGFESANSAVKSISDVHEEGFIYRNSLLELPRENAVDLISDEVRPGVFKIDGRYYEVGRAFNSSVVKSSWNVEPSRYTTDEYKLESLIAIYKHVEKIAPEFPNDMVEVYAVTGLPINHVKDPKVVQTVKDVLENTTENSYHEVNGRKFRIMEVKCTEQGLSAFLNDLMLSNGEYNKKAYDEFKSQNVIYVDNGFGTSDCIAVSEAKPFDRKSLLGIENAVNKVKEALEANAKHGTGNYNAHFWNSVLREGIGVAPSGTFSPQDVALIEDLKERAYSTLAKEIITGIHNMKIKIPLVHKVVFVGGASLELKPYLEKELDEYDYADEKRKTFIFPTNERDARLANARGYLKFAKRYFAKKVGVLS